MQLVIVIILCIFVILCMWIVQYSLQTKDDESKEGFKLNLKNLKKAQKSITKQINNVSKKAVAAVAKTATAVSNKAVAAVAKTATTVVKKAEDVSKKAVSSITTNVSAPILKLIPPVVVAKLATIAPAIKKEQKKIEKDKRKKREKQIKTQEQSEEFKKQERERIRLENIQKEKNRIEQVTKTINKLLGLATIYPQTKYDIQTIVNSEEMNNFIHGRNIIDSIQTYVNGPFTEPEQLVLLIKMLRESMALTAITYA